ncbi:MAG: hypothetical protein ABIM60_03180 [candidate division WOR-3 bacterium]
MIKLIIFLCFVPFYYITPVNWDKAGIKKGQNSYNGINGTYLNGKEGNISNEEYKIYIMQLTWGVYRGYNENLIFGIETSLFVSQIELSGVWDYTELFGKVSFPINRLIFSIKTGICGLYIFPFIFPAGILGGIPRIFRYGISLGIPNPEKFTLSYFCMYYKVHTFNISFNLNKNHTISIGYTRYWNNPHEFYNGFNFGIGHRE